MILSFYSYKGGVGRTQLLANLAAYLCYYRNRKVLVIDWDLEAPGLPYYFGIAHQNISKKGVIDLFNDYVHMVTNAKQLTQNELPVFTLEEHIIQAIKVQKEGGQVDLISAGNFEDNYYHKITNFNWNIFYEHLDGKKYVEYLKSAIKQLGYDYIFVDSRIVVSNYSGICNVQFADANVLITVPTHQSFDGTVAIAKKIANSPYRQYKHNETLIMPILSRLDKSVQSEVDKWSNNFLTSFKFLLNPLNKHLFVQSANNFAEYYLKTTVLPYERGLAFGEALLFDKNKEDKITYDIVEQYINVSNIIESLYLTNTSLISHLFHVNYYIANIAQWLAVDIQLLDNSTLKELKTAIQMYTQTIVENREDFSLSIQAYIKALETELNAKIIPCFESVDLPHNKYSSFRKINYLLNGLKNVQTYDEEVLRYKHALQNIEITYQEALDYEKDIYHQNLDALNTDITDDSDLDEAVADEANTYEKAIAERAHEYQQALKKEEELHEQKKQAPILKEKILQSFDINFLDINFSILNEIHQHKVYASLSSYTFTKERADKAIQLIQSFLNDMLSNYKPNSDLSALPTDKLD